MKVATLNGKPSTTIIFCWKNYNASDETDLDALYNELSSLLWNIPKHNVLIVGRNMNIQIGKNVNNIFSLHNLSNLNEGHLTEFTLENGLTCLNIKFQKRKGKPRIYTYVNNAKAQITSS